VGRVKHPRLWLRDFRHRLGKFASRTRRQIEGVERRLSSERTSAVRFGVLLAPHCGEHHVFRAAVLSIVLTLAVGPNVTLLCRTWCDLYAAAASGCHHEASTGSPIVAGNNSCDHEVPTAGAFLREEGGAVAAPIAAHAIFVPRHQLARLTTDARHGLESGRERSLDKRPLSATLRI